MASEAQKRVLEELIAGRDPTQHFTTMSQHGGYHMTLTSLRRAGFVDGMVVTDAGRAIVAPPAPAPTPKPHRVSRPHYRSESGDHRDLHGTGDNLGESPDY
jgi:hypothetical protein